MVLIKITTLLWLEGLHHHEWTTMKTWLMLRKDCVQGLKNPSSVSWKQDVNKASPSCLSDSSIDLDPLIPQIFAGQWRINCRYTAWENMKIRWIIIRGLCSPLISTFKQLFWTSMLDSATVSALHHQKSRAHSSSKGHKFGGAVEPRLFLAAYSGLVVMTYTLCGCFL